MSRSTLNFIVDAVAFAALLFLASTGILIHLVLPPGSGHFSVLWGMDRHQWGEIHQWLAVALLLLMALHLFLHWSWVVSIIAGSPARRSTARAALAVAALAVLVGVAISPYFGRVEGKLENGAAEPPHRMRGAEPSEESTYAIDGTMTLLEVQDRTGVRAEVILQELGLPSDTPTDERLGRLRKKYGFEIHDVRAAVAKHAQRPQGESKKP